MVGAIVGNCGTSVTSVVGLTVGLGVGTLLGAADGPWDKIGVLLGSPGGSRYAGGRLQGMLPVEGVLIGLGDGISVLGFLCRTRRRASTACLEACSLTEEIRFSIEIDGLIV